MLQESSKSTSSICCHVTWLGAIYCKVIPHCIHVLLRAGGHGVQMTPENDGKLQKIEPLA